MLLSDHSGACRTHSKQRASDNSADLMKSRQSNRKLWSKDCSLEETHVEWKRPGLAPPQNAQLLEAVPQLSLALAVSISILTFQTTQPTYPLICHLFPLAGSPGDCISVGGGWRVWVHNERGDPADAFPIFTSTIHELGAFSHPKSLTPKILWSLYSSSFSKVRLLIITSTITIFML